MTTAYTNTIDSAQAAAALGVTRQHFTDRLCKKPGFPAPVINFSQRSRRWRLQDVLAWAKTPAATTSDGPRSAPASRGSTCSAAGSNPCAR